jgi:hypothetical protein
MWRGYYALALLVNLTSDNIALLVSAQPWLPILARPCCEQKCYYRKQICTVP